MVIKVTLAIRVTPALVRRVTQAIRGIRALLVLVAAIRLITSLLLK
jgi:hypothetical protein